jgi:hypothetical protein
MSDSQEITSPTNDTSPRFTLSKVGLWKAGRLLLVAGIAGVITALPQVIGGFDFGIYNVLVTTLVAFVVEIGRRFVTDYSK